MGVYPPHGLGPGKVPGPGGAKIYGWYPETVGRHELEIHLGGGSKVGSGV